MNLSPQTQRIVDDKLEEYFTHEFERPARAMLQRNGLDRVSETEYLAAFLESKVHALKPALTATLEPSPIETLEQFACPPAAITSSPLTPALRRRSARI